MEKALILQRLKEEINYTGGSYPEIMNLQESDIEIGDANTVRCNRYEYTCTAAGEKFGGDFRFPLTKTYESNGMWLYKGDKTVAKNFLVPYLSPKVYKMIGGCFENMLDAVKYDADAKLREEFKLYNCMLLVETLRIDDFEITYDALTEFRPIYWNKDTQKIKIGYAVTHSAGETVIFSMEDSNKNIGNQDPNWLLIILGLFFPPVLFFYLIYLLCKKK